MRLAARLLLLLCPAVAVACTSLMGVTSVPDVPEDGGEDASSGSSSGATSGSGSGSSSGSSGGFDAGGGEPQMEAATVDAPLPTDAHAGSDAGGG